MSTEIICLVWSTLLGFLYINAQVITLRIQQGRRGYDPNRERQVELGVYAGRGERALWNFLESYPLFIALAVSVELADASSWTTQWGAVLYVGARLVYLPLYILGIAPLRSAAWAVSFVGLAMMFAGVLF